MMSWLICFFVFVFRVCVRVCVEGFHLYKIVGCRGWIASGTFVDKMGYAIDWLPCRDYRRFCLYSNIQHMYTRINPNPGISMCPFHQSRVLQPRHD